MDGLCWTNRESAGSATVVMGARNNQSLRGSIGHQEGPSEWVDSDKSCGGSPRGPLGLRESVLGTTLAEGGK